MVEAVVRLPDFVRDKPVFVDRVAKHYSRVQRHAVDAQEVGRVGLGLYFLLGEIVGHHNANFLVVGAGLRRDDIFGVVHQEV